MGTGKPRPDPGALLEREYLALVDAVRRHWRRDEEGALDLVHDAVVRVYESFGSFDPAKGEFRAWLWGILKHAAAGRPQPHPRPAAPVEASPLGDLVAEEVFRFVGASVAALPPAYRRTVEMRFFESVPLAGIARALKVPLGTVKARLSRAPDMLRQTLSVQATTARFVLGSRKNSGNPATFPASGGKKEMEERDSRASSETD